MMAEPPPLHGRDLFEHPLAAATLAVLRERGFRDSEVADYCARAGVGLSDLHPAQRDKRLLVLAVSEAYVEDFEIRVRAAYEAGGRWPDNLRAAAYEALRWIGDHPNAAWWGTVGVLEAGDVARARRDGVFAWAARLIEAGREVAPDPHAVPTGTPLMVVGSIIEMLGRSTQGELADKPVEMVPRLMYAAVRPYLGEMAALRELTVPPPPDLAGT